MVSRKIQQTNKGQYTITIPSPVAEVLGWKKGTELEFNMSGKDRLELRKK